jgi:hypothetical protein
MKSKSGITVGQPTKYKKVRFSVDRILKMAKDGKKVSEIARALGYPPNAGQNRVRRVLILTEDFREHKKAGRKSA